jgi:16S rRNA processing protein RimM
VNAAGVAADPARPPDALEVGRIVDAWGVKGWFKVQPFSSDPQALLASRRWFLSPPEDALPARPGGPNYPASLAIADARFHGEVVVAQAAGIADRGAAEALRGARIFLGRSCFPAAGTDEYYWADLIGLQVENRQGIALGTVSGLLDTGAHSVLRVRSADASDEAERLIPFVAAYVDDVDFGRRVITVDWGLDF